MMRSFVMLLILLAITGLLIATAWSEVVKLAWNPNPPAENIAKYLLYLAPETQDTWGIGIDTGPDTAHMLDGVIPGQTYRFAVSAINTAGEESDKSEPLIYTIPFMVTLTLQSSHDLQAWAVLHTMRVPLESAEFFRIKIEQPARIEKTQTDPP